MSILKKTLLIEFIKNKKRLSIMANQVLGKNWQKLFDDTEPSKILVVDANGQSTAAGDKIQYNNNNQHKFSATMQIFIRQKFRINWKWAEEEFGITIIEAKIIPIAYDNKNYYKNTTEQIEFIREYDLDVAAKYCNALCQLIYKNNNDKNPKKEVLPIGIFLRYFGNISLFVRHTGYFLVHNARIESFQNILRPIFQKQFANNIRG